MRAFTRALLEAENRLRAEGLTGELAFHALTDTLMAMLGGTGATHPALEGLTFPVQDGDLLGLAYERFFPDVFKGRVGQFFTPGSIGRLMLSRLPVGPGVDVLDPTCGSGGLLREAVRSGARVRGQDVDPNMVRLARLNLRLLGCEDAVIRADVFRDGAPPADVVLANPPFSVDIRARGVLDRFELGRQRRRVLSDVLFVEALETLVKPGGHAAVVLPWTVVANPSMEPVRERIDAHWVRRALLQLPEGVFRPFGGAAGRAAVLWLQRRPAPKAEMEWAVLENPGFDVRSTQYKSSEEAEVDALCAGEGWIPIAGWLPDSGRGRTPIGTWVSSPCETRIVQGDVEVLELADTDRRTGEAFPEVREVRARRAVLSGGEVVVSRMRPELGNVAILPPGPELYGSPEWIRLRAERHRHWLFHALRSPTWRDSLPPTSGQTRPRTDIETVLKSQVPRVDPEIMDRFDRLSESVLERRRRSRSMLGALQQLMDAYMAGEVDEGSFVDRLSELEAQW